MPSRKAVTFSGNPSPASARSRRGPVARVARVASNRRSISSGVELPRQRQRREPRAVQDLVGVGVADAAEEARVGERALERVVLAHEPRRRTRPDRPRGPRARRARTAASAASPRPGGSTRAACVPASVRTSVPVGNSKDGERDLAGRPCPRRRATGAGPAIIRWMTTNRSRSSASTIRLPMRRRPVHPAAGDLGRRRADRAEHERVPDA